MEQILKQTISPPEVPTVCRFMQLPLEVRRHIYNLMLAFDSADHLNLLCLSEEIYNEARESFFRRRLAFKSQAALIEFVNTQKDHILKSITNLNLRLEEVEPEVMQPFLASVVSGTPIPPQQHPYLVESNRIMKALAKMPGITQLSLLKPSDPSKNPPSSIVVTKILNCITVQYEDLRTLRLDIESCHIDCLGLFPNLKKLELTGFSETSSLRTADVLSKLKSLDELTIFGPPQGLQMRQRLGHQSRVVQSITHQVFEQIRPLKRLTINQVIDPQSESGIFLSSMTMKALYEIHADSLEALTISSSEPPRPSFVEFLSAFLLATPSLRELRLTWPNMEPALFDSVPTSLTRLEWAVESPADAQALVDRLILMEYRLSYLRDIQFHIINRVTDAMVDSVKTVPLDFNMPTQNLAM